MDEGTFRVLALAEHLLREQLVDNEVDARLAALLMLAAADHLPDGGMPPDSEPR